jgi:hypothetical protein
MLTGLHELMPLGLILAIPVVCVVLSRLWLTSGRSARAKFLDLADAVLQRDDLRPVERWLVENMIDDLFAVDYMWKACLVFPRFIFLGTAGAEKKIPQELRNVFERKEMSQLCSLHFHAVRHASALSAVAFYLTTMLTAVVAGIFIGLVDNVRLWQYAIIKVSPIVGGPGNKLRAATNKFKEA